MVASTVAALLSITISLLTWLGVIPLGPMFPSYYPTEKQVPSMSCITPPWSQGLLQSPLGILELSQAWSYPQSLPWPYQTHPQPAQAPASLCNLQLSDPGLHLTPQPPVLRFK